MELKKIICNDIKSAKRQSSFNIIHIKSRCSIKYNSTILNSYVNSFELNENMNKVNFLPNFVEVVKVESYKIYNYDNNYDILGALTSLYDPDAINIEKNQDKFQKQSTNEIIFQSNIVANTNSSTQNEKTIINIPKNKPLDKSVGLFNVLKKWCKCKCQIY